MCGEIESFQRKEKDFGEEKCRFGEDEQNLGQALLAPNDEEEKGGAWFQEGDLEGERRWERDLEGKLGFEEEERETFDLVEG